MAAVSVGDVPVRFDLEGEVLDRLIFNGGITRRGTTSCQLATPGRADSGVTRRAAPAELRVADPASAKSSGGAARSTPSRAIRPRRFPFPRAAR